MNEVISIFIAMLFVHWVADFAFQSHKMAMNKSTDVRWLLYHCAVYAAFFIPFGIRFALWMLSTHYVIDYVTSRINKRLWAEEKIHDFFVCIGLDQFLHFVCLAMAIDKFILE